MILSVNIPKLNGRVNFHAIIIKWSYRKRGKQQRVQMNSDLIIIILSKSIERLRKIKVVMNLMNKIIPYSLIKIKANIPPPYSILNPETISDSPSDISKGVRLDSARQRVNQIKNKGSIQIIKGKEFDKKLMVWGL